jgi:branched-chain amino acid transport system ATP-binding protein
LLEVRGLQVNYSDIIAVRKAEFSVEENEVVSLVGSNGAGKTTVLKTISGLLKPQKGEIRYGEHRLDKLGSDRIVEVGVAHVPEGRGMFPRMSVEENILLGAFIAAAKKRRKESMEKVFSLFPRLRERKKQLAGTLSGGEQQMLAIARGLMALPKLLMLDEPSLGLAPLMVQQVFEVIMEIESQKTTILLVEQNVNLALAISHRGYVLENGVITLSGTGEELLNNEEVKRAYLGL